MQWHSNNNTVLYGLCTLPSMGQYSHLFNPIEQQLETGLLFAPSKGKRHLLGGGEEKAFGRSSWIIRHKTTFAAKSSHPDFWSFNQLNHVQAYLSSTGPYWCQPTPLRCRSSTLSRPSEGDEETCLLSRQSRCLRHWPPGSFCHSRPLLSTGRFPSFPFGVLLGGTRSKCRRKISSRGRNASHSWCLHHCQWCKPSKAASSNQPGYKPKTPTAKMSNKRTTMQFNDAGFSPKTISWVTAAGIGICRVISMLDIRYLSYIHAHAISFFASNLFASIR